MKNVDYLIVGFGIAGVCLAEHLLQHKKSFVVIDNTIAGATAASGGVMNPTVLKRFTAAWNASQFFQYAYPFYDSIAKRLEKDFLKPVAIQRILNAVEEQNNWAVASDKHELSNFLLPKITENTNQNIKAKHGLGHVRGGALLQPKLLLETFRNYLLDSQLLVVGDFKHEKLLSTKDGVSYDAYSATQIVFAEGALVRHNPYFQLSISPNDKKVFVGNKGEYIIFHAPNLQLNAVLKGPVMIIPLGNDLYKAGASFGRDDFSENTTTLAREEIVAKVKQMISCELDVVDQVSGIRPTVKDRKPLLGKFSDNASIYFLNGLGTRGLSMAPLLSKWLVDHIESKTPLPKEVNLNRFLS